MRLSSVQREFAYQISCLIHHIHIFDNHRYDCTFGDAYRDPRVHGQHGIKVSYSSAKSDHKLRLAIDLNLYKDDQYQTTTEAHRPFGEYWKALHPDNYWGGDFDDGNHYGRKR